MARVKYMLPTHDPDTRLFESRQIERVVEAVPRAGDTILFISGEAEIEIEYRVMRVIFVHEDHAPSWVQVVLSGL